MADITEQYRVYNQGNYNKDDHKFLLYIDILGFAELAENNSAKILGIFDMISTLSVLKPDHEESFEVIVYSDTILIYNKNTPVNPHNCGYQVSFLCDFAQELFYRLIGDYDIYFRAQLRHGHFVHKEFSTSRKDIEKIPCFYGQVLIDSHRQESDFQSIGLVIHNNCKPFLSYDYKTTKYNNDFDLVYLLSSLNSMQTAFREEDKTPPIQDNLLLNLSGTDAASFYRDISIIKKIHSQIHNNELKSKDRLKYLAKWHFYRAQYSPILDVLEKSDFNPASIFPSFDW